MKAIFRISGVVLVAALLVTCSQSKRLQNKHFSTYELETLQDSIYPLNLPYNRWVSPAGELIHFGDQGLENHALDCALSPDEKWIAIEGRYSVIIVSPETKKTVYRFRLKDEPKLKSTMCTFSGITWLKKGKCMNYTGVFQTVRVSRSL